jgi:hypothetical protein
MNDVGLDTAHQRASQNPSRLASKATATRSILCPAFCASARHRRAALRVRPRRFAACGRVDFTPEHVRLPIQSYPAGDSGPASRHPDVCSQKFSLHQVSSRVRYRQTLSKLEHGRRALHVGLGSSAGMQSKRSARLLCHLKLPKLLRCRPDACPQDTRSQASSETIGAHLRCMTSMRRFLSPRIETRAC